MFRILCLASFDPIRLSHTGRGVPPDDEQAAYWYQKAAEQGHMEAQHNLGFMYAVGVGVKRDDRKAVYWLQKAADQGITDAKEWLLRHS